MTQLGTIKVETLEKEIPALIRGRYVEGLSVALIQERRIAWAQGFGVRNVGTAAAVTPDTVFEGASFSKPATAYVALKMAESGLLDLDRPLSEYVPRPFIPDDRLLGRITLRMVLSHTRGLSHDDPPRILFEPGKRFSYSACGFDYLQYVIEHLSGKPFHEYMRIHLLAPLEMHSSTFIWDGHSALPYAHGHEKGTAQDKWMSDKGSAAASLHTTPSDFARLLLAIMQPDTRNRFHLGHGLVTEMLTPQVVVRGSLYWGLGWGGRQGPEVDSFCIGVGGMATETL